MTLITGTVRLTLREHLFAVPAGQFGAYLIWRADDQ